MKLFLAGHRGLVGQALLRRFAGTGIDLLTRPRQALDLTDPAMVRAFLTAERPDMVVLAAARVGGIRANLSRPADFLRDNLAIQTTMLHEAFRAGVRRLLFFGSSCCYPRQAPQPIREEALLSGPLEPTNQPYAIAKIAGIALCDSYNRQYGTDYRCLTPTNLYGPHDTFSTRDGHVIPALIRRFDRAVRHRQPTVTLWGSGKPRREFLHADDLADAAHFLLALPGEALAAADGPALGHLNVGSGDEVSIADLAGMIAELSGFAGTIRFDPDRPDGTPRKRLDCSRLTGLGWRARIGLRDGLAQTWRWYQHNRAALRT